MIVKTTEPGQKIGLYDDQRKSWKVFARSLRHADSVVILLLSDSSCHQYLMSCVHADVAS